MGITRAIDREEAEEWLRKRSEEEATKTEASSWDEFATGDGYDKAITEIEARNQEGLTLLDFAAIEGDATVVAELLSRGARVNHLLRSIREEMQPIHCAVRGGSIEVIKLLLDYGADVNAVEEEGHTPTSLAIEVGENELAQFLMSHGGHV